MSKEIIKYTDTQKKLLEDLKTYIDKFGVPKAKDFLLKNGLRSYNYYREVFDCKSLKDILEIVGIKVSEKDKSAFYSDNKNLTDEELLQILKDYYRNIGFPTQRKFTSKNGLPSYTTYWNRFGSFKNAILLSGIEIPKNRLQYFDREKLSNEEMLKLLEYYTSKKLETDIYLLTNDEIDNNPNMPHSCTYQSRFGGIIEAYKLIGYNYSEFNNDALEKDMIIKFKELAKKLGRTPNSRELDKCSQQGFGYSMGAYEFHFGSLYNAQIIAGLSPTVIGRNISRKEMIKDLQVLYDEIGRLPTQRDINANKDMASLKKYSNEFGSFTEALKVAGFKNVRNNKVIISPNGNMCFSSYEYDFCCMLENYNFDFKKDEYYKKYIKNLNRYYQFDFTIFYKGEVFFIEIFGLIDRDDYRKRANTKINLCKSNNLKLIDLYADDFKNKNKVDLYNELMSEILKYKEGEKIG